MDWPCSCGPPPMARSLLYSSSSTMESTSMSPGRRMVIILLMIWWYQIICRDRAPSGGQLWMSWAGHSASEVRQPRGCRGWESEHSPDVGLSRRSSPLRPWAGPGRGRCHSQKHKWRETLLDILDYDYIILNLSGHRLQSGSETWSQECPNSSGESHVVNNKWSEGALILLLASCLSTKILRTVKSSNF